MKDLLKIVTGVLARVNSNANALRKRTSVKDASYTLNADA